MIVITIRILPESARWLISQGRKERAIKEIRRAAKVNGREFSEDLLDKVNCIKNTLANQTQKISEINVV